MGNIRVHELAKELKKSNREVSDRIKKLGIPMKSNLSSLTEEQANEVRVSFGLRPVRTKAAKKPAAKKADGKPSRKPAAKKADGKPSRKPAAKKADGKPSGKPAAKKATETAEKKPPVTDAGSGAGKVKESPEKIKRAPVEKAPPKISAAEEKKPPAAGAAERAKSAGAGAGKEMTKRESRKPTGVMKETAPKEAVEKTVPLKRMEGAKEAPPKPEKAKGQRSRLRVAPAAKEAEPSDAAKPKTVYRFVPRAKRERFRTGGTPSTVARKMLRVPSGITVRDFAQMIGLRPVDVIKKLTGFGEMLEMNEPVSEEALRLLAEDMGIEIRIKASKMDELEAVEETEDRPEDLRPRAPVVTVMGHVDHGKTLLLDAIRHTDVVSQEMGGITQHIGAYQVGFRDRQITFIDTPGHESFTAMRARGTSITDVVVLVVAADDGVMPQTLEALDHARAAGVPVIVAVNKIDKPEADGHRVRQQLSEKGLIPDDWGGDTVFVDVSAKEGTNIDHLLEMILLISEIQELRANPDVPASGVVVEAKLDRFRGPVVTLLIRRGTAKVGDVFVAGNAWGRVRAMFNDRGDRLASAGPSEPVEVLGLSSLPMAGDEFRVVEDEKKARQISGRRADMQRAAEQLPPQRVSLENLFERLKEEEAKELRIILKADTQGSLEAILESLEKVSGEEVKLRVIHSGVGGISETDVMLASASEAIVLGFNVRPDSKASKAAEAENVEIKTYQVIYQLVEDVEAALEGMLEPVYQEEIESRLEVRQTFRVPGIGLVAGSYVLEGEINRNSRIRVIRDGVVVHDGRVGSLRRFKDDVRSVAAGFECGVGIEGFQDLKVGDVLETYSMRELPR